MVLVSRGVVLVADDEPTIRGLFKEFLEAHGYEVTVAASAAGVLNIIDNRRIDAVVLDRNMPDGTGDDVVATVSDTTRVIVVSGLIDPALQGTLQAAGAFAVLQKPIDLRRLADVVRSAVEHSQSVRAAPVPDARSRESSRRSPQ